MRLSLFLAGFLLAASLLMGQEAAPETKAAETTKEEAKPEKRATAGEIRKWMRELGDPETAVAAADKLYAAGGRAARMINMVIKDWSAPKRMEGVKVLAQIKSSDARRALARRVIYDKDKSIRNFALEAIRNSNTAKNYILEKALSDSESMRKKAAWAICCLEDKKFVDILIAAGTGRATIRAKLSGPVTMRTETLRVRGPNGDLQELPLQLPSRTTTEVSTTVSGTLEIITGKNFQHNEQWRKWWKGNRRSFSFPVMSYPSKKK